MGDGFTTEGQVTTFIDPAILNDETAAGISKPARALLATVASICLMPYCAAEMMEPPDADLEKLDPEVRAFGLRLPPARIVGSTMETEEFDRGFHIARTHSADGIAIGMAAALIAAAKLCRNSKLVPAESALLADSLYLCTEQIVGVGLLRPTLVEGRAEACTASISPRQRWMVGHSLFVGFVQALILAHRRIRRATAAGDSHLVSEQLRRAATLFHGAAVSMRLTGAMSPPEYERIRKLMMPPHVREGFSGTWNADHRCLLRIATTICHTLNLENPEIAVAHDRYLIALNAAYSAHAWVCQATTGEAASLAVAAHANARSGHVSLHSFARRALIRARYSTAPQNETKERNS